MIFVYLSGRLFFYDLNNIIGSAKNKGFIKRIIWGLSISLFVKSFFAFLILFIVYLFIVLFDSFVINPRKRDKSKIYFLHLFFGIFLIPLSVSIINMDMVNIFNPVYFVANFIYENLPVFKYLKHERLNFIVLTGFVFTIKEGTIIIRLVLAKMSAVPKTKEEPSHQDKKEYDRGKLIGILERSLIYFLIIFNQVGAIAIIIALKSLARFKELDDKNFAEYFLIGSLLSICVATLPAVLVKAFF